ncbi:uncharacterized protein LOC118431357 [Branchiostoma floridae]|uniref:Uncharacterized protein LOC118431357 n=1 Tax=Branchiostoma floridae TaxID=7739 RepID=A0A9J7MFR7_BRAFL|nr:uncharacterized protein LOC118431357 [Branchiostoma floridae]
MIKEPSNSPANIATMDRLHRQAILDCYEDISRDMDPKLVLRYSTVHWRDEDPGVIRAKERTEGRHSSARALLDKLLDLPYDGFDDFVQSLSAVPYDHLVEQLLEARTRLRTRVERGEIRMRDLGRRRQDTTFTTWTLSILVLSVGILVAGLTWALSFGTKETSLMTVFPRRLKTFVGREDVFGKIDACLEQNQTCLIKGLGGVGKTTLTIEYAHRRANVYDGTVFWVRLASTRDLCASISQYILYFNGRGEEYVLSSDDLGCKSVKMHFREYLTNTKIWLLVVDEVSRDTMKELGSLLPHSPTRTMHILLTSQEYQRLDMEHISVVSIPPFSHTEALAMFDKTVRPSDEDDRREIESLSRSLGHHPLALQFAYSYISATDCSIKDYHAKYIEGYATQKVDLLDKADVEQSANRKIRQTFQITFQYVANLSTNAAYLLSMASFVGPDCIPCPKAMRKRIARLFFPAGQLDKLDTIEMVSLLERFSLASHCHFFQPCGFSVNRIVQEVIVAEMDELERLFRLQNALEYSALLLRNTKHTSRVQAEFLMSHVHYVALNLDRYQTKGPFPASSINIFFNKSADFFCRWDACDEAYYFFTLQSDIRLRLFFTSMKNGGPGIVFGVSVCVSLCVCVCLSVCVSGYMWST